VLLLIVYLLIFLINIFLFLTVNSVSALKKEFASAAASVPTTAVPGNITLPLAPARSGLIKPASYFTFFFAAYCLYAWVCAIQHSES
jgi:hypothetical protein